MLAVVLFLGGMVSAVLSAVSGLYGDRQAALPLALVYVAVLAVPIAVRRRWPATVAVIVSAAYFVAVTFRIPEVYAGNIAMFIALYTVGAWSDDRRRAAIVRIAIIVGMFTWLFVVMFQDATTPLDQMPGSALSRVGAFSPYVAYQLLMIGVNALFFGGAYYFGERSHQQMRERAALEERTAELEAEREVTAAQAVALDRVRIARELHDVVAHSMSVIQVQASTAKYRVPGLADEATAEFDDIAATARASLVEMRRLLGVLRTEDQVAELTPQQGIADLPALAESLRRVGADITLQVTDTDGAEVPPSVQIAAFRIVQEGMSNAVRHAPGAPVAVDVRVDDAAVHLRIHNGASRSAGEHGAGHGLRGMLERAELLGGGLSAGPDGEGGWLVVATLPVTVSSEPRTSTPSSPSRPVSTKDRP